ncbi:hypothetical protein BZG14_08595 [Salinivibrio sp. IB282]|nr:hypothetical protein BZG14_08595 [Salinivibrio sp. IB282]
MKKLIAIGLATVSLTSNASGLLRTTDLKSYCDQEGVDRQTILYLDQSIIAKEDPNWYKDILNKTKFLPGERVKVVTIKDGGSNVELSWDTCYPAYTKAVYKKKKSDDGLGSMFVGGIDDKLENDQKEFSKLLPQALAHPLQGTKNKTPPQYQDDFPVKKLVEALYYDSNRLDIKSGIPRVIVFSDMVEKSDLIKPGDADPEALAEKAAERFPVFFNHAEFYIYGVNYTNSDTSLNESMESFWTTYLLHSGANVAHYGTQLVLPKDDNIVFEASSYDGKLTQSDGKKLATSMRLAYLPNGELKYSWLVIGD